MLHYKDISFDTYYEIRPVKFYSHFEVDEYFLGDFFTVFHWKVIRDTLGFAVYCTTVSSKYNYPQTLFHCRCRTRLEALHYILCS